MQYQVKNGIHIIETLVADFKIIMCDTYKKSAAQKDYCNAGFFANFREEGEKFTLPVGHVVCDYEAVSKYTKHYCSERGTFLPNGKFQFDSGQWSYGNQFYGKKLSTLFVSGGRASIVDTPTLPTGLEYAISGVPIMRDGEDVKFATYVKGQGWDGSTLYGTWHVFLSVKQDGKTIYLMGMKTSSTNMILSAEAYKKFKALGMYDVIKLDGGGSFTFNVGGKAVASTSENRRINTIITFGNSTPTKADNPYPVPKRTLVRGRTGDDVKWLQSS